MQTASVSRQGLSSQPVAAPERYALVKLDGMNLMLQQDGIRTLESLADLRPGDPPENGIGWIDFQQAEWPVYCLTEDLAITIALPPSRRICALLSVKNGFVGLACNEVVLLQESVGRPHVVPDCMTSARSPITALVHYGEGMACLTSTHRLADYLGWQGREAPLIDKQSNPSGNDHGGE
jgi:hypothetical protein